MPVDLKGYHIVAEENGGYSVYQNGVLCSNTKAAMREIAALIGMQYDTNWTTLQFGARLLKAIGGDTLPANSQAPAADNAAVEKAEAESAKAKAKAEKEKAKAEEEKAKAETAIAAAKAAAEAAQAEAAKDAPATKKNNSNGALNGLFSVGENKKVRFSMGNLQFNAKKYEWRFAEHQYDIIGKDNEKIANNYDGWIDLFGYGTSGYLGCEPFKIRIYNSDYPNQDIANTNYDWGVYNPITNGGNKEGLWRTLTLDEWQYLLNTRPNAKKLCIKACVNGVNGILLLPDGFYGLRVSIPMNSTPSTFQDNSYNLTQWATLEAAGVVFLPLAGYRFVKEVTMGYCEYWSSSYYASCAYACYGSSISNGPLYNARSVRLVQDVKYIETPVNTILLELIRGLMKTIVLCELEKEDTDLSHADYNNQRVLISSLFKGDYNIGQIILRLTVIDSLYSTNAAYSYFSTEEMAKKIYNLGSQSKARDYFYKVACGEKDDQQLFSENYGFQKNLSEGSKQMSLLSKYAFYELLQEPKKYPIGFPIYDRLAKEAYPLVRKMLGADYDSMPNNGSLSIEQYIQCLTQLREVLFTEDITEDSLFKPKEAKNAFQQFDILDAYLWRMGRFSEGNLSLLLKREDYEQFIKNIELAAPKEKLKEDFKQLFPNQTYNFSKLILSRLQSDKNPFARLTNEKYMNALLQHWRVFEGYRNIAQKQGKTLPQL